MNIVSMALIALTVVGAGIVHGQHSAHKAFLKECVDDGRKVYQCEVLWGESRP